MFSGKFSFKDWPVPSRELWSSEQCVRDDSSATSVRVGDWWECTLWGWQTIRSLVQIMPWPCFVKILCWRLPGIVIFFQTVVSLIRELERRRRERRQWERQKQIGLISKTTTLHSYHAFCTFLLLLTFTFCEGQRKVCQVSKRTRWVEIPGAFISLDFYTVRKRNYSLETTTCSWLP